MFITTSAGVGRYPAIQKDTTTAGSYWSTLDATTTTKHHQQHHHQQCNNCWILLANT